MDIVKKLHEVKEHYNLYPMDCNGRSINIYTVKDAVFLKEFYYYPDVIVYSHETLESYRLINEIVMSLKNVEHKPLKGVEVPKYTKTERNPVFFFMYNIDNYFHFIYDTLPYLISYFKVKKDIPELKLLINHSDSSKSSLYKFVTEFLAMLGIAENDMLFVDSDTKYSNVYVSNSYTHDIDSNLPPREEVYELFRDITNKISPIQSTPNKIYVSRRSWIHADYSNIGTNYTTRRKMQNENELVEYLKTRGFVEIFTENMSTMEKLSYFMNAETVVGAIGGGLCNVLFSNEKCKLVSINSPEFLNVNKRFEHTFKNVKHVPFDFTYHTENAKFKLYMRVKVGDTIGEIIELDRNIAVIAYSDTAIAGWKNDHSYKTKRVDINNCEPLDNGLNSEWKIDIEKFRDII